jgi:hypothetical protein
MATGAPLVSLSLLFEPLGLSRTSDSDRHDLNKRLAVTKVCHWSLARHVENGMGRQRRNRKGFEQYNHNVIFPVRLE